MQFPKTLLALSLCAVLQMGFAAEDGSYIEGNFGESSIMEENLNGHTNSNSGFGWSGSVGYQFNHYFAVEVGYTRYADVDITESGNSGTDQRYGYHLASKIIWPIKSRWSIFAKLGAAQIYSRLSSDLSRADNANRNQKNTNLYYGAGLGFDITPWFAISAQYNRVNGNSNIGDSSLASFGGTLFIL